MKDGNFLDSLKCTEAAAAWNSFVIVVNNFWGNKKVADYAEIVENLLENFQKLEASVKFVLSPIMILINFLKILVR